MGLKASKILMFPFSSIAFPLCLWSLGSIAAATFPRGTLPITMLPLEAKA